MWLGILAIWLIMKELTDLELIPSEELMIQGFESAAQTRNWSLDISRRPLPKGELRIARQFTAGFESEIAQVPKGRLNPFMSYVSLYSHCVLAQKIGGPS